MAGLAKTIADLAARARTVAAPLAGSDLSPVARFGSNPGGLQMWMHLPEGLPTRAPLVVVLHGCGQTAGRYAESAGWIELSERYGFALLCPEQVRANNANLCFNWFEGVDIVRDLGEAASIAQMVRFAITEHGLDAGRVFVTGLSAGGAMTAALLATYPELFAAGAVIAGLPYGAASNMGQALSAMRRIPDLTAKAWGDKVRAAAPPPKRWPRLSIWHGDADTTVSADASEALARQWCDVHGVSRPVHELTELDRHAHRSWRRADGEVAVELHRIAGLAHGTPIAALGEDGCGSPAPWILETGLSSSQHIARFWGIADARRRPRRDRPHTPERRAGVAPPPAIDVADTIARALRGAGLLR